MKKLILLPLLFFVFMIRINAQVCTLDTFTIPGIYPDTIVNLPKGYATAPFSTVIQVRVFTDTFASGFNVDVDDIEINSVSGLPAGFSYACFPTNCKFPGGGNGCINLTGTPTVGQIGTHNLVVNVTLHGKILGAIPVSQASQILGYKITILGAPVVNFSAASTTLCQGETVVYTDLSTNQPTSWNWTFPGGTPSTSTLQNPSVKYNTSGNFSASLIAANPAGNNSHSKGAYITVNNIPSANISPAGSISVCPGSFALLTANSGTGFTYQWIRNGVDIAGATGSTYIAGTSGIYKVRVIKPNGCFKVSTGKTVSVVSLSAIASAGGSTTFCSGGSVLLSANTGAGLSYQWRKNGVNIGGATGNNYSATTSGIYKVVVTGASGCTKLSNGITVTANSLPAATITAGGPLTFCTGGSVLFSANSGSGLSYQWKRNGNNISGATLSSYSATTAGTYKVIVTNNSGCSKSSPTKTVVINCKDGDGDFIADEDIMLYPNPSSESATIKLTTSRKSAIDMAVYDQQGKRVSIVRSEIMEAGSHEFKIETSHLSEGLYLLRVTSNDVSRYLKMVVEHP